MKKIVLFSLMLACLPFMVLAQSGNDDLYYIPKKKKEKKEQTGTPAKVVLKTEQVPVVVTGSPGTSVVVKDVSGNVRDVDEYNRRYTSRENEFSYENDTLYIQEKPYLEQGEWVSGFEGSQSDYDYAMRIIRFRSPRFAVSVSSPYYWDVISLGYTWDWNVYDTGMYAYAFPRFNSSWWWDWRYNNAFSYRYYPSSWVYTSHWCYPSSWWYGWGHHYPPHIHHSHWHAFPPHYAHGGVGGYWGNKHGWNGSSAKNPGIHAGRYMDNHRRESFPARNQSVNRTDRLSRNDYVSNRRSSSTGQRVNREGQTVRRASGRVVTSRDATTSVRPQRSTAKARGGQTVSTGTTQSRSSNVYTRQSKGRSSSYNRASSTRTTVKNTGSWGGRSGNYYNGSSSSSRSSGSSGSYSSGSSRSSSASYSSGSSGGGAGRSASAGGTSRSSGGRR